MDPKEPRTELSTFWPKLKVAAGGTGAESSVGFLLKEKEAGGAEEELEEEDGAGGGAAVGFLSSEPPSEAAP